MTKHIPMTLADRDRLAAILGMLGSEHQGERAAAALQAEAFRRKHQLTWAELLAQPPIEVAPVPPAAEPEPPPQPPANDYPGWSQSAAEHAKRFHEAGQAAYPDWKQLCEDLIQMGADAQFATLLIARPDGIRLVAALANDPKSVRAIAALKTEAARARALAEFAVSSLHQAPPPPPRPTPSPRPRPNPRVIDPFEMFSWSTWDYIGLVVLPPIFGPYLAIRAFVRMLHWISLYGFRQWISDRGWLTFYTVALIAGMVALFRHLLATH